MIIIIINLYNHIIITLTIIKIIIMITPRPHSLPSKSTSVRRTDTPIYLHTFLLPPSSSSSFSTIIACNAHVARAQWVVFFLQYQSGSCRVLKKKSRVAGRFRSGRSVEIFDQAYLDTLFDLRYFQLCPVFWVYLKCQVYTRYQVILVI